MWFFCSGCVFRLDLSGYFGEYDEEGWDDEVQDDFDHDGRFLGGVRLITGARQQIFFGFALLLQVVVTVSDWGGGRVGGFAQFLNVLGGAFVEKPFE